jgi:hypothetical protein
VFAAHRPEATSAVDQVSQLAVEGRGLTAQQQQDAQQQDARSSSTSRHDALADARDGVSSIVSLVARSGVPVRGRHRCKAAAMSALLSALRRS